MRRHLSLFIILLVLLRFSVQAAPLCSVVFSRDFVNDKYADVRHGGALDVYFDLNRNWIFKNKPVPPYLTPPENPPSRLDLSEIHFMQNNISNNYADSRYTVIENARMIRDGKLDAEKLPPIRVWRDTSGKVWTLDHRRLVSLILSGKVESAKVEWATQKEVTQQRYKMSTLSEGKYLILTDRKDQALIVNKIGFDRPVITNILPRSLVPNYQATKAASSLKQTSFRAVQVVIKELPAEEILFSTDKTETPGLLQRAHRLQQNKDYRELLPLQVWMDSAGRTWTVNNESLAILRIVGMKEKVPLKYLSIEEFNSMKPKVDSQSGGRRWMAPLNEHQVLVIH